MKPSSCVSPASEILWPDVSTSHSVGVNESPVS